MADNTWKSYARSRSILEAFQKQYKLANSWPVPVDHLVQFIAFLSLKHLSAATIRSYISGISFSHKLLGIEDTTKSFIISKMLEGLHRRNPRKDVRAPITLNLLKQIVKALPHVCSSSYECSLFKSAFILAFFAFLRVGEFTAKHKNDSTTSSLQITDISITNRQLTVLIKKSKTDQRGYSSNVP